MKASEPGTQHFIDAFADVLEKSTPVVLQAPKPRRGRPSRKQIETIIAASRGGTSDFDAPGQRFALDRSIQIGSALGVGSVLNPELNLRFKSMLLNDPATGRRNTPVAACRYLNIIGQLTEAGAQAAEAGADYFALQDPFLLREQGFGSDAVKAFLLRSPGYDAYFMAGPPSMECIYPNLWLAYGHVKKGFSDFAQRCTAAASWSSRQILEPTESRWMGGLGVLIASPRYWQQLSEYIATFIDQCERAIGKDNLREELRLYGDELALCLLSEFRKQAGHFGHMKIRSRRMEATLNTHENNLRELKDLAAKHDNPWLMSVWSNYADLYRQTKIK